MKALIVVTGRGLGGDASIAINFIKKLEQSGVECEIALDESAPGLLFKKKGYDWHKISVPAAGGHVATKASTIKAAFKMLTASFKIRSLIKKLDVDFVFGIIGGGAIVGAVGAKLANVPGFSLISTPLDTKICPKLSRCYVTPESPNFNLDNLPGNTSKTFLPSNNFEKGNFDNALQKLKKIENFDENKKTILFSSGSSIFKGIIDGINNFAEFSDDYNLLLIGLPLQDDYLDNLNPNIIYLSYIDWLGDLYDFVDLAIVTDDGLSIQEAILHHVPTVCLTRVKWGRYHDMASVFKGATIEAEVYNLNEKIQEALSTSDELKENSKKFAVDISASTNNLIDDILKNVNEK